MTLAIDTIGSVLKDLYAEPDAVVHFVRDVGPLAINHTGQLPSVTVSFNLAPGKALGDAVNAVNRVEQRIEMPASINAKIRMRPAEARTVAMATLPRRNMNSKLSQKGNSSRVRSNPAIMRASPQAGG